MAREVDDLGEAVLSFAEVKALTSGNPLILEKAGVDSEVAKLSGLARAHHADQARLVSRRDWSARRSASMQTKAERIRSVLAVRTETRADRFTMDIGERAFTKRPEAGEALQEALLAQMSARMTPAESPGAWSGGG